MKSFIFALQFLTIIPIRTRDDLNPQTVSYSVIYFPLVGLILGLILVGLNTVMVHFNFAPLLVNVILVVALIILTGGLHLDGLADTFDALGSYKDRESCLRIMRDSHIGTMGVLALISVILLKANLLFSIEPDIKNIALLLMCVISRWALTLPMWLFPYAREEGKGKIFFEGMNLKKFLLATVITLSCAILILKIHGTLVFLIAAIFTYIFSRTINQKIGGITGDILGATNELVEILVLLSIYILNGGRV